MKLSDFDYNLPKELIAQYPSEKRDESRLLVLHRNKSKIEHRIFKDIVEYFHKLDLLVLNNTEVIPSRLTGRKLTGGKVEALVLLSPSPDPLPLGERERVRGEYEVLLKPARGCGVGSKLIFGEGKLKAQVARIDGGRRFLRFECNGNFQNLLNELGQVPLPPYIKRKAESSDKERYQTIYASKEGAVAAPTAGLHFTKDVLSRISKKGVDIEYITLHVGYGTFRPVRCEDIRKHRMEKEYFEVHSKLVEKLKTEDRRIVAVGTTTCRVLETIASIVFEAKPRLILPRFRLGLEQGIYRGWTDLFIYPPYRFKNTDALLTNFHLPRTTLFMLVSAFCGRGLLLEAYKEAIERKYRFYSYGDAMLVI